MPPAVPGAKSAVCPACGVRIQIDAATSSRITCECGRAFVLKTPASGGLADRASMYGPRRPRAAAVQMDDHESSAWANVYFPMILGVGGAIIWVLQVVFRPLGSSVGTGAILSFIMLVVSLVVMVCGVFLASKFLDADFGNPAKAVMKLAATAVFAAAVFAIISSMDMKSARGPILAWHITILVYLVAFKTMFDLDLVEALMTSAIVGVLLALASIVIFQVQT